MTNKNIETQKPTEEKAVEPLKGEGLSQLVHRLYPQLTSRECYKGALVLAKHNDIPDPDLIKFGQKIRIPENFEDEVKKFKLSDKPERKIHKEAKRTIERGKQTLKKLEREKSKKNIDEIPEEARQRLEEEWRKMADEFTEGMKENFDASANEFLDDFFSGPGAAVESRLDYTLEWMARTLSPRLSLVNRGMERMISEIFSDSPDVAEKIKARLRFTFEKIRYDQNENKIVVEGFTDFSRNKRDYEIVHAQQEQHEEDGVIKQKLTLKANQLPTLAALGGESETSIFTELSREKSDKVSKIKLTINGREIDEIISPQVRNVFSKMRVDKIDVNDLPSISEG